VKALNSVTRFLTHILNIVEKPLSQKVLHRVYNVVLALEVTVNPGRDETHLTGKLGHTESFQPVMRNNIQGFLRDLLLSEFSAELFRHDLAM